MPRKPKSTAFYKIRRKIPDPLREPATGRAALPRRPNSKAATLRDEQLAIAAVETVAPTEAQPFLKWVGGKAQLLAQFDEFFPLKIDRYVEPFIGGGAVFFHLKHRFPQMRAFLRDNNDELINTYQAVRDYPKDLMRRLDKHLAAFLADRENYYYLVRSRHHLPKTEILERAARMIFLNKNSTSPSARTKIPRFTTRTRFMKPYKTEFYGYHCDNCGISSFLDEKPEDFIICPFCGGDPSVKCDSVWTVHVEKIEPYPIENWEVNYRLLKKTVS